MATVTLPFTPDGNDTKDIGQIMADFQAILDELNGNLQASVNVAVATAVTQSGTANGPGSSSNLARSDHTHLIQGLEQRTAPPSSGHFVGRLYVDTTTKLLMVCVDDDPATYFPFVLLNDQPNGALVYVDDDVPAFTAAPTDDQILRAVGDVPTWVTPGHVHVTHASAIAIANNTDSALSFDTERFDQGSFHDPSSNSSRLTVPAGEGGIYLIGGNVQWEANAANVRQASIRKNGSTVLASVRDNTGASFAHRMTISTLVSLDAADYVELLAFQNSGGNLNIEKAADYSPEFWIARLA
jgi:hypothetical protein